MKVITLTVFLLLSLDTSAMPLNRYRTKYLCYEKDSAKLKFTFYTKDKLCISPDSLAQVKMVKPKQVYEVRNLQTGSTRLFYYWPTVTRKLKYLTYAGVPFRVTVKNISYKRSK